VHLYERARCILHYLHTRKSDRDFVNEIYLCTNEQSIETNARVYIIMEEAGGGDLLNTVRKYKRIAERQAAIWFRQLCDAVEYCHQRGIVHRDLKCENILLDSKVLLITYYY